MTVCLSVLNIGVVALFTRAWIEIQRYVII